MKMFEVRMDDLQEFLHEHAHLVGMGVFGILALALIFLGYGNQLKEVQEKGAIARSL